MGGVNSCWLPHYQNPNQCRENHTSTPKIKGHKRNLSAAFNMADIAKEANVELVNINSAAEEELMTLPGINRSTAHNIVDYRRQIGGFKKVEDLALVSGVGATKLNQIRLEISVTRKKTSQSSSRSSSTKDLSAQDNISKSSSKSAMRSISTYQKMNLNTSNVFQLMKVKGISQEIAQNIVAYRERKGLFKNIDDLVKVKGLRPGIVSAVRPYLVLTDECQNFHRSQAGVNGMVPSSSHMSLQQRYSNGTTVSQNYNLNVTSPPVLGTSQDDLLSLYGPLVRKSIRKVVPPITLQRDERRVIRIATWNLQNCTSEKMQNPGVREVIAMTIFENGLSIVAIQELAEENALTQICEELNRPTVPSVKKWMGQRGTWKYVISETSSSSAGHLGVIYDASQGIELLSSSLLSCQGNNGNTCSSKAYKAQFKLNNWHFELFNTYISCDSRDGGDRWQSTVQDLTQVIHQQARDEGNVVILGHFDRLLNTDSLGLFEQKGYWLALAKNKFTNISSSDLNGSRQQENIWIGGQMSKQYTGESAVVRDGLSSPWIPDGWKWGGLISEHCPVWAEFYVQPSRGAVNGKPPVMSDAVQHAVFS